MSSNDPPSSTPQKRKSELELDNEIYHLTTVLDTYEQIGLIKDFFVELEKVGEYSYKPHIHDIGDGYSKFDISSALMKKNYDEINDPTKGTCAPDFMQSILIDSNNGTKKMIEKRLKDPLLKDVFEKCFIKNNYNSIVITQAKEIYGKE